MNSPLYTAQILRLAASIPHLGKLESPDGSADLRSPTCGSTARVQIRIEDGRVSEVAQLVKACAFGQAAAALMGEHAIGCDRDEVAFAVASFDAWLSGKRDDPGDWPGLEAFVPARSRTARHGALLLPFRALVAAIEDSKR